jgi:hypothetical protein
MAIHPPFSVTYYPLMTYTPGNYVDARGKAFDYRRIHSQHPVAHQKVNFWFVPLQPPCFRGHLPIFSKTNFNLGLTRLWFQSRLPQHNA